jgi:hypothetical protein
MNSTRCCIPWFVLVLFAEICSCAGRTVQQQQVDVVDAAVALETGPSAADASELRDRQEAEEVSPDANVPCGAGICGPAEVCVQGCAGGVCRPTEPDGGCSGTASPVPCGVKLGCMAPAPPPACMPMSPCIRDGGSACRDTCGGVYVLTGSGPSRIVVCQC